MYPMALHITTCGFHVVLGLLFSVAVISEPANPQNAAPPRGLLARSLLKTCLENQRRTNWIVFQGHSEHEQPPWGNRYRGAHSVTFKRSGDLLDVTVTPIVGEGYATISKVSASPYRIVLGPGLYIRQGLPSIAGTSVPVVAEQTRVEQRVRLLNDPSFFGVLDGYLECADGERVADLLLEGDSLRLLGDELVGQCNCKVIEGKSKCGVYKLWLDLDCGCLPRRASLVKRADDFMSTGQLLRNQLAKADGTFVVKGTWLVSDIVLSRVADTWIATRGKCSIDGELSDGTTQAITYTLSRSDMKLYSNIEKPEGFQPTIADGAIVLNLDDFQSGIRYAFKDGKVKPAGTEYVATRDAGDWTVARSGAWFRLAFALGSLAALILATCLLVRRDQEPSQTAPESLTTSKEFPAAN